MPNPFGLNPIKVENFYAYPKGHKHYGKIKLLLNYVNFNEGEEIAIDTEQARIEGTVEKLFEGNIVILKMKKLIHKRLN